MAGVVMQLQSPKDKGGKRESSCDDSDSSWGIARNRVGQVKAGLSVITPETVLQQEGCRRS